MNCEISATKKKKVNINFIFECDKIEFGTKSGVCVCFPQFTKKNYFDSVFLLSMNICAVVNWLSKVNEFSWTNEYDGIIIGR